MTAGEENIFYSASSQDYSVLHDIIAHPLFNSNPNPSQFFIRLMFHFFSLMQYDIVWVFCNVLKFYTSIRIFFIFKRIWTASYKLANHFVDLFLIDSGSLRGSLILSVNYSLLCILYVFFNNFCISKRKS